MPVLRISALLTLLVIVHSSLSLNHELPSLSMPPAYKEERTEPALSRSLRGCPVVQRPVCPLQLDWAWKQTSVSANYPR